MARCPGPPRRHASRAGSGNRNSPCGPPSCSTGTYFSLIFTSAIDDVASRTFEDSAGVLWEVFEVHRSIEAPRGVSAGLEQGWLAFASAGGKRRLAPYPSKWESASVTELERLCTEARLASPARYPGQDLGASGEHASSPGTRGVEQSKTPGLEPVAREEREEASLVRDAVRVFAHEARTTKLPAIEAMVRLKSLLHERYGGVDTAPAIRADAADMRRVRKWFVEAFYFERP